MPAPSQSIFHALTAVVSLTCTALIANAEVNAITARANALADTGLNYIKLVQLPVPTITDNSIPSIELPPSRAVRWFQTQ